jgi:PEP-CTERM motif
MNPILLPLLCAAALTVPQAAQAKLMQATVTGTISGGSDSYSNSVLLGAGDGTSLVGLSASVTILYDADLAGPNYPGYEPNWSFTHEPNYPAWNGSVGMGPVRSASFTVNGITLALDVSGDYEYHSLMVSNPTNQHDSYTLFGSDKRSTWCPSDRQCVESVSVGAYQSAGDDLFGGQHNFSPAEAFTVNPADGRVIEAYVRMFQSSACPAGMCPEGRFADTATHWVDFRLNGTQLSVAAVVPEPETYAMLLAGLGLVGVAVRRRIG